MIRKSQENSSREKESSSDNNSNSRRRLLKKRIKKIKVETSEESEECSKEDERRRKQKKKGRKSKADQEDDISIIERLLYKLDNRKVPELEPFDENAGIDLEEHIERFEEYYRDSYKGGKHLRLKALEKQLTGRTLEGLRSVKQNDEEYETVKRKLIEWYEGEEDTRKELARRKFEKAAMKSQESTLRYSNRLLQLFKFAHPNKKFDKSQLLINKWCITN